MVSTVSRFLTFGSDDVGNEEISHRGVANINSDTIKNHFSFDSAQKRKTN